MNLTGAICSEPACQRGPSKRQQRSGPKKETSHFDQTSKEDIAHSAINDWVQAMTSVETANVGKTFHHRRAPRPMAGWICDEEDFATYQVSNKKRPLKKSESIGSVNLFANGLPRLKSSIKLVEQLGLAE